MLCRATLFAVLSFPFYLVLFYVNARSQRQSYDKISLICCFNGMSELKLDIRYINLEELNSLIEIDYDFLNICFMLQLLNYFSFRFYIYKQFILLFILFYLLLLYVTILCICSKIMYLDLHYYVF